jgi:quercetin dioxygenase-like cupin family protein
MAVHEHGAFGDIAAEEPYAGVLRRSISSAHSTVTSYEFGPNGSFPIHRHPSEQITLVQAGDLEFTVDGVPVRMGPGDWSIVEPGVEHGLVAGPEGARIVAIVSPRRQGSTDYEVVGAP